MKIGIWNSRAGSMLCALMIGIGVEGGMGFGASAASPPKMNDLSDAYSMGELTESRRKTKRVTLRNEGGEPLEIALSLAGDDVFSLSPGEVTLEPGTRTQFTIAFFPITGGDYSTTLTVRSNDPDKARVTIPVTGSLVEKFPKMNDLSQVDLGFGDVAISDEKTRGFTLRNTGEGKLSAELSLEGDGVFGLSQESVVLNPGSISEIMVSFSSATPGDYAATLRISSNDPDQETSAIQVTGRVTEPPWESRAKITTVVGNGNKGFSGDGGRATETSLNRPNGLFVDDSGNIYFADTVNHRIRRVDGETSIITTVAGGAGGDQYYQVDLATSVTLEGPDGVFVDDSGNLFIAGTKGQVFRVDNRTNIITAIASGLKEPADVQVDASGNVYVAERFGHRVITMDQAGVIRTVAGDGNQGYRGDGGPAASAGLDMPTGLHVDAFGNTYIAEFGGNRIRKVDGETGIITTVAGNGGAGFSGDGGTATSASIGGPRNVFVEGAGTVYIADFSSNQLRREDRVGELYIAAAFNNRIRKVDIETGIITTVAGSDNDGFAGDGGKAINASLSQPTAVFVDGNGAIYISDSGNDRIRMVEGDPLRGASDEGGIELNRKEIGFADVQAGDDKVETLTITNMNSSPFELALSLEGDGSFGLSTEELSLAPGASQEIGLTFAPTAAGEFAATLKVTRGNSMNEWVSVSLKGKGTKIPEMEIGKERVLFFDLLVGSETIEEFFFSNEGTFSFDLILTLEGDGAFKLAAEELSLAPGVTDNVKIAFAPSSLGEHSATLKIEYRDLDAEPITVPLRGRGIEPFTVIGPDSPAGPIDDPLSGAGDFVRSGTWKLARKVNLGPQAGNNLRPSHFFVDLRRNRGFVFGYTAWYGGETPAFSVVDLQVNAVADLITREELGIHWESWTYPAINGSRDELYTMGTSEFLQVIDLNTVTLKKKIDLGSDARQAEWAPRILAVDEWEDRLYLTDGIMPTDYQQVEVPEKVATHVFVVDLSSGQVVKKIPVNSPMVMALDRGGQGLYLGNGQDRTIEILDLEDSRIRDTIQLGLVPYALQADPQEPYLYVFAREPIPESWQTDFGKLLRIDLRTNTVDGEITVFPLDPHMVVDAANRTLWLISTKWGGSARYKVGLEDFGLLYTHESSMYRMTGLGINPGDGDVLALEVMTGLVYRMDPVDGRVKSRIELGVNPVGVSVSEVQNQVFIPRGGHGGFFVLDERGDLINTIESDWSTGLLVDEYADRLFVSEKNEARDLDSGSIAADRLVVYELSTLRLVNRTDMVGGWISSMKPDHERGVLWVLASYDWSDLYKLDLLSGEVLERHRFGGFGATFGTMELAADTSKAYVTVGGDTADKGKLRILDLVDQTIVGTIDLKPHLTVEEGYGTGILDILGMDTRRNRLYVSTFGDDEHVAVIDTERDEVIEVLDLPGFNDRRGYFFDFEGNTVIHPYGRIIDLETLEEESLDIPNSYLIAQNRITNTIYTVSSHTGELAITLGPSGTEVSPPPVPDEVTAEAGDEEVVLSWTAVDDSTLVGYHVYRRDRTDSDFTRITRLPLKDTSYTDLDLTNERTYTYRLSSIGKFALESLERTEPVAAMPVGGDNFDMLVLRKSVSVTREDSVSLPMSIEPLEGFDEEVMLSAEVPAGLEVVFSPEKIVPPRIVEVKVRAAANAPLGRFELTLQGESSDKSNTAEIVVEVTAKVLEQSVLTLDLDQEEVPLDIPLSISGRLFPGTSTQVQLDFRAEHADTLITLTVNTDKEGGYRAPFQAPFTDKWSVTASWTGNADFEGAQSRTVEFAVTSGKTRITATSDLADNADLGWIATVKGRIYPNPGTVAVTLNVRKPDGTEERIEGLLASEEGFYGHDLRMDQQGLWEVWTSWKGNDRLLGAASSVMTIPVAADVGRVLLVACGQDSPRDIFWPTSNYLANLAYTTFQQRRLLKEKIVYLNDRQEQDVDRDGFQEDVDGGATMDGIGGAWDWVKERVNADNPLYVYLVGKGTPMGLEVSPGEVLTATQLGTWLDEVESSTGTQATLIVEAAHAGNFIRDLSSQGRKVIGSTGPGLAFYQAEGYMSFSQYFLTDLYQGKSLQEAFLHTHNILRNLPGGFRDQRPGLEAEGNVIANQPGDYLLTMDAFIGAPFELGDLSPQIKAGSLSSVAGGAGKRVVTQTAPISEDGFGPRLKLAKPLAQQGVEISARIDDAEGNLKVVRAMIIPPESDSLSSLTGYPEVELASDGGNKWSGVYSDFLEEGVYPVIIYAIDGAGNAAEPLRTTVLVEPPPPLPTGDFNGDGLVDFADFFMFADQFGGSDPAYDLDGSGQVDFGDFFLFADAFGGPLGKLLELAEEMLVLPTSYELGVPYPNPFNSEVVVRYTLPGESAVELVVYNELGQVVRRLVEGHQGMGHHRVMWDGRDGDGRQLATGMYVVRMRAGEWRSDGSRPTDLRFQKVQKVVFLK